MTSDDVLQSFGYVLCRPYGGFNDTLCQIERCWRYALQWKRQLVVDCTRSGMRDDLSRYFRSIESAGVHLSLMSEHQVLFDRCDVYPGELTGRVSRYRERVLVDAMVTDEETGVPLTFDFGRSYGERCLVHHQGGGGNLSVDCLTRLRIEPVLAGEIKRATRSLGGGYYGIHIRNTDYTTDYEAFFRDIKDQLRGKRVLICSDDARCVCAAKTFFDQSDVVSVSEIPDLKGAPLHARSHRSMQEAFDSNRGMLLDLFCLAQAQKLFICRMRNGDVSGFSVLAANLNGRLDIVDSLLGRS